MKYGSYIEQTEFEHIYENVYECFEYGNGTKCVRVTTSNSMSDLMKDMGQYVQGNWFILYTLLLSRCGNRPGRYQGIEIECYDGVNSLFNKYKSYFDGDGRHNIWIGSTTCGDLLVYDKHNIMYAYGPIDDYIVHLKNKSFCEGEIKIPAPHTHHYNPEFDTYENDIMKEWDWKWFELNESDDE